MPFLMHLKEETHEKCVEDKRCPTNGPALSNVPCVDGKAGDFECSNVDLLSYVSLRDLGSNANSGNDIWGWTDPETKKEYAIACCEDGTSFVDVTDPVNPVVLGFMRTHTVSSSWRDVKARSVPIQ